MELSKLGVCDLSFAIVATKELVDLRVGQNSQKDVRKSKSTDKGKKKKGKVAKIMGKPIWTKKKGCEEVFQAC